MHDQIFLTLDLYLGAGILAEQHFIANFDVQGDTISVVVFFTFTYGDDCAPLGLFFLVIMQYTDIAPRRGLWTQVVCITTEFI
mgnify:CR=1 FL=1